MLIDFVKEKAGDDILGQITEQVPAIGAMLEQGDA